jgi:hypothetical protein
VSEVKTTSLAAFASQLRAWRQQMNWTQVEAADKLGYSASLVSGIETMAAAGENRSVQHCRSTFPKPWPTSPRRVVHHVPPLTLTSGYPRWSEA